MMISANDTISARGIGLYGSDHVPNRISFTIAARDVSSFLSVSSPELDLFSGAASRTYRCLLSNLGLECRVHVANGSYHADASHARRNRRWAQQFVRSEKNCLRDLHLCSCGRVGERIDDCNSYLS